MLTSTLSLYLGTFIVWGFLMSFFLNLFFRCISVKKDNLLVLCSFVIFLSYFISDHFYELFDKTEVYKTWFLYDIVTLVLIAFFHFLLRTKASPGVFYVYLGLSINTILFGLMHLDIVIFENKEQWILWDIYTAGVNIADFTMIVALITDRDILGLIKLKNQLQINTKKALN